MIAEPAFIPVMLKTLFFQTPVLLVCLMAAVVALAKWRQAPTACGLALTGFGLAFLLTLVSPTVSIWLSMAMRGQPMGDHGVVLAAFNVLVGILRAASYVLLLLATFANRSPSNADASNSPPMMR
jgi:hypothetical protein